MSSSDFRQILLVGGTGKAERLFRAAVSAFCSLTRPTRRETAQLEDLTLPLYESVSVEGRRYVAAVLSELEHAPAALVRRLADEPPDISAPLLMRSAALSDIDLIALIGRHGLPHARAIGRRPDLNPTIADLIRALERPALVVPEQNSGEPALHTAERTSVTVPFERPVPGTAAEEARGRLRAMMRPSKDEEPVFNPFVGPDAYAKLRETALSGNMAFFQTALADALDIDFRVAGSIIETPNYFSLLAALRALDLSEERAFLIAAAVFPSHFSHAAGIKLFTQRYYLLHREAAVDRLRSWKAESLSAAFPPRRQLFSEKPAEPANSSSERSGRRTA